MLNLKLGTLSAGSAFLLWLSLVASALISTPVHGYSGWSLSGPSFNTTNYQLGASGSFTVRVDFYDGSADIGMLGIRLYFVRTDGTLHESQFFGVNYGNNPLSIPADNEITLSYNFLIPNEQTLVSGRFYCVTYVTHRGHGTVQYSNDAFGPYSASSAGYYCYLSNPLHPDYSSLQSQVTSLQSQVNSLQSDKTSLQSQVGNLQSQVSTLQSDKSSLQSQVSSLQLEVSDLQTDNANLQSQTTSLNSQVNNLQSQLSDAHAQNTLTTNLALLGILLAVVFVATTIYFAVRKPNKPKLEAPPPLRP